MFTDFTYIARIKQTLLLYKVCISSQKSACSVLAHVKGSFKRQQYPVTQEQNWKLGIPKASELSHASSQLFIKVCILLKEHYIYVINWRPCEPDLLMC